MISKRFSISNKILVMEITLKVRIIVMECVKQHIRIYKCT